MCSPSWALGSRIPSERPFQSCYPFAFQFRTWYSDDVCAFVLLQFVSAAVTLVGVGLDTPIFVSDSRRAWVPSSADSFCFCRPFSSPEACPGSPFSFPSQLAFSCPHLQLCLNSVPTLGCAAALRWRSASLTGSETTIVLSAAGIMSKAGLGFFSLHAPLCVDQINHDWKSRVSI